MPSRRTFLEVGLKAGVGACAAGAVIRPILAQALGPRYYKAVFDERFGDSCAFAAGAAERGIPTAAIRGDITNLFFDDLDLRWRQGPVVLAGYTTPASLFCLDLLARDRGMRVRHCVTEPGVEAALGVLDGAGRLQLTPGERTPSQSTAHLPSSEPSVLAFWIIAPNAPAAGSGSGRWRGGGSGVNEESNCWNVRAGFLG